MKRKLFLVMALFFSLFLMINSFAYAEPNLTVNSNTNTMIPTVIEPTNEIAPDGFNPLTANAEDLNKYGFPQKPTDPEKLKKWTYAMQHAKHYVKPDQSPSQWTNGTAYNNHWAGYVIKASDNIVNGMTPKYTEAQGSWVQPTYTGSSVPAFWVGMGGYSDSYIVQAGADSNATYIEDGVLKSPYEFWVEDYPIGVVWEKAPALNGGNTVYVDAWYTPSSSYAFLENITTGSYTTVPFSSQNYTGSSADFIYEMHFNYANFTPTTLQGCWLSYNLSNGTNNQGAASSYASTKVIMTNTGTSSGTIKASPRASLSNASFTITTY